MRLRGSIFAAATCAAVLSLSAGSSEAQVRYGIRGEVGVGTMLSSWQRGSASTGMGLGFDQFHFEGTGRVFVGPISWLSLQLSVNNWVFLPQLAGAQLGHLLGIVGGVRLEPMIGSVGRLWLDVNAGVGFTGNKTRFEWDPGVGFEFQLAPIFALGPYARFTHVFQPEGLPTFENDSDAMFWTAGASFTLHNAPPPPTVVRPPSDLDSDGVIDDDDQCPSTPMGENPHPTRRGCPNVDTDGDHVWDSEDQCVTTPAGDHPDPARRGCPRGDRDNDTIWDDEDQCADVPQGEHPDPTRRGCPDGDADADGVLNGADQCRDVPTGPHPDPARAGCPLPDRDSDNVADPDDACPDQPGAPNPDRARNGCPGLLRVGNGRLDITQPVYFRTASDRIQRRSFLLLQAIADAMVAEPALRRVSVEGHTDERGNSGLNQALSERRAQAVVRWLVEHRVDVSRLEAHGFAAERVIVSTARLSGRAARAAHASHRRVEFRIVDGPAAFGVTAGSVGAGTTGTPAPTTAPTPASPTAAAP